MDIRLALLGDSIAAGVGATRSADALGPRFAAALAAEKHNAQACAFAVPGAVSAQLETQVRRAMAWEPDVAVIVVGANDLLRLVPPQRAAEALRVAVRRLRAAGAEVVVAPAPDLSIVPDMPRAMTGVVQLASATLRRLQTAAVLAEGGRLADADGATAVAFQGDPAMFAGDRFHPSSTGYAVIAEALLPVVRRAVEARAAA